MKIPGIFIAVIVAVEASRPPPAFDSEYQETSSYIESPTPPPRPSFLRSYSRQKSSSPTFYSNTFYSNKPPSFNNEESDIFSGAPPSRSAYREGHIFFTDTPFSSSYFPPYRSESFQWEGPTVFREGQVITYEYKGPPPPPPLPTKDPPKQVLGTADKKANGDIINGHRSTLTKEESKNQQQHQTTTETRQLLAFGGHSNHLSFGNHGLGFASVAAITSADINPLAIARITATTKPTIPTALGTSASTISMQSSLASGIEVSQQHLSTNPTSSESPTSAATASSSQKIAGATSSQAAENTPNDVASTTPTMTTSKFASVTSKLNLDSTQTTGHQINGASIKYYVSPKTSYDFRRRKVFPARLGQFSTSAKIVSIARNVSPSHFPTIAYHNFYKTITHELPAPAHGLLPIESAKQQLQLPDVKPNLFFYDAKNSYPFSNQQLQQQIQQQLNGQNNNNNVSPVRFSIPITPISTNPGTGEMKLTFPALDFARSLSAAPNTYSSGQNHVDMSPLKLNPVATNAPSNNPSYYFLQPQEQAKPATQISSNIPLGSFYFLPNNAQAKQPIPQSIQVNSEISPGLQMQLSGFGGIEYLMSPSNLEQMRHAVIDAGKGIPFHEQYRPTDTMLTKIGFGQNLW